MSCKESTAIVTNIQRYCVDDGPGIRTTVFLKGCPLRCVWCHNPETYSTHPQCMQREDKCTGCLRCTEVCPAGARKNGGGKLCFDRSLCISCGKCAEVCPADACEICGKEMTVTDVMAVVSRDRRYYDTSGGGLTVSGGECSMQKDFTLELIKFAKDNGISSCIETCGFGKTDFFMSAAELGVHFLFDLKVMDEKLHKKLCGVSNSLIHDNLSALIEKKALISLRLPMIPGINDSDECLISMADYIFSLGDGIKEVQIMPYHPLGLGKAKSLGIEQAEISREMYENGCKMCRDRWNKVFSEHGVRVI